MMYPAMIQQSKGGHFLIYIEGLQALIKPAYRVSSRNFGLGGKIWASEVSHTHF